MGDEEDKESLRSLERQDKDVRFPQLECVRSPKRPTEDELSDNDTISSVQFRGLDQSIRIKKHKGFDFF